MRYIIASLLACYTLFCNTASGQIFDQSTDISNQVDNSVVETLTGSTEAKMTQYEVPLPPGTVGIKALAGEYGQYSGFRNPKAVNQIPTMFLTPKYFINQETFNAKDASIPGMGDTTTYLNQVGCDFTTPYSTDIQVLGNYQNATRELGGSNVYRDNGYGATLNISQKIIPFAPLFGKTYRTSEPGAVLNLGHPSQDQVDKVRNNFNNVPDFYPNFDMKLGLAMGFTDNNIANFGHRQSYATQDAYSLSPNMAFDFYFKRPDPDNKFSLMPNAISIVPTWNDQCVSANNGTSSSAGVFSVQERNTYTYVITPATYDCDYAADSSVNVDAQPAKSLVFTQSNTLLHDTNQEPLQAPATPVMYQNWAKFGLAISYVQTGAVSAKVEYTYEAFNAQYASHNVVLSINVNF